jgi:hypothetical protein
MSDQQSTPAPEIKAALDAAGHVIERAYVDGCNAGGRRVAVEAIKAFLCALPCAKGDGWQELWNTADLALLVEEAANHVEQG